MANKFKELTVLKTGETIMFKRVDINNEDDHKAFEYINSIYKKDSYSDQNLVQKWNSESGEEFVYDLRHNYPAPSEEYRPDYYILIACSKNEEGDIVANHAGFFKFSPVSFKNGTGKFTLVIDEDMKRKNLGTEALNYFIVNIMANENWLNMIEGKVFGWNQPALDFYRSYMRKEGGRLLNEGVNMNIIEIPFMYMKYGSHYSRFHIQFYNAELR